MAMPARKYLAGSGYRYGFGGKEKDDEVKGDGNNLDFGARIYDPRIARWNTTDPVVKPWLSSYQYGSNNPVNLSDPDGGDEIHFHYYTVAIKQPTEVIGENGMRRIENQTVLRTYRWVEIVKDNKKDRFFVHRNGLVPKAETIEFYPNSAERTKSGATSTSYVANLFTVQDDDYTSLQKMADDFPELKQQVLQPEFNSANSGWSQHKENRKWWMNFYNNLDYKHKKEEEREIRKNFALGVLTAAASEIIVGRLLLGAEIGEGLSAANLYKSALVKNAEGLTAAGRAVTKHPTYFGFESLEELQKIYKTTAEINQLGASRVKDVLRAGIKSTGAGGRYSNGWVTYTLQDGRAASWNIDGSFIGFRGPK